MNMDISLGVKPKNHQRKIFDLCYCKDFQANVQIHVIICKSHVFSQLFGLIIYIIDRIYTVAKMNMDSMFDMS